MAYHQARKAKDLMDEAERRAIADSEAAELAGSGSDDATATTVDASEGAAAE
jgi:DNA-directed RNA polymerase subunit beta'